MNLLAAVTFADGIGVDDLTRLAELIAVVTTIVAAVWALLRPLKRQADRIEMFWSDWNGTPARPGHSAVPGVMDRLASIDGHRFWTSNESTTGFRIYNYTGITASFTWIAVGN